MRVELKYGYRGNNSSEWSRIQNNMVAGEVGKEKEKGQGKEGNEEETGNNKLSDKK
jgi:hypothetical protein